MFQQAKGLDCSMVHRDGRKEVEREKERGNAITASASTELLD